MLDLYKRYCLPEPTPADIEGAKTFIADNAGPSFPQVKYRPQVPYTLLFGLVGRFQYVDGKMVWGFPNFHTGVDRSSSDLRDGRIKNPVYAPFDFDSFDYINHKGKGKGSEVLLYHKNGFCLSIAHMLPAKIRILKYKNNSSILRNTIIGSAGSYGFSTGVHTHTEITSGSLPACTFLDAILLEFYGANSREPYSFEEIASIYKACSQTKDWDENKILSNYNKILRERFILFANKYKLIIQTGINKITTYYSTKLLFNI